MEPLRHPMRFGLRLPEESNLLQTPHRIPHCAAVIVADPATRAAAMEATTAALAAEGAVLVRVGNPLSAPLTLRRLLIQVDPGAFDHDNDADEAARLAALLERRAVAGPVVLVIDQAETLEAAALLALQQVATGTGGLKVVFLGGPAFWQRLDRPELAPLRHALNRPVEAVGPPPVVPVPPAAAMRPAPERWLPAASRSGRRWWLAGAAGLLITGVAAVLLAPDGLFHRGVRPPVVREAARLPMPPAAVPETRAPPAASPAPAPGSEPAPIAVLPPSPEPPPQPPAPQPPAPPPQPLPDKPVAAVPAPASAGAPPAATPARTPPPPARPSASPPAPPAGRAEARHVRPRTRFEQFVAASGYDIDSLSDDERSLLLDRFLAARPVGRPAGQAETSQAETSQAETGQAETGKAEMGEAAGESRVIIHYSESSTRGETVNRLAEEAAPFGASVQTVAVTNTPFVAEIRFFHPEDYRRARQLAAALRGVRSGWLIRDFSAYRLDAPPGTIEVWLPAR